MKRIRLMIGIATTTLILLAGCAGTATNPAASTQTGVAAAEVALTAAEKAALTYASLPQCPVGAPICSDAATIAKVKAGDNTAYAAVKAARASGASADIAVANAAIAALVSMVPEPAATPIAAPVPAN